MNAIFLVPRAVALLALLFLTFPSLAHADVRLPKIFGDDIVVQRDSEIVLWGWARRGEKIEITVSWEAPEQGELSTTTDDRYRWQVPLKTPGAGGPHTITIAGDTTIVLDNVLAGDVWVCSGQSNMEWPVSLSENGAETARKADDERLRVFTVAHEYSLHPRIDVEGKWQLANPSSIESFSAVAYHFGRELRGQLDVPIGLIVSSWGGTQIEAWMSEAALGEFAEFKETLALFDVARDPNRRRGMVFDAQASWWADLDRSAPRRPGGSWRKASFDDGEWPTMALPASLSGDLGSFDGLVYFRRTVELPSDWDGQAATLELGPIDDRDTAWVNGRLVGETHAPSQWNVPRRYSIPAGVLKAGANTISVRMLDTGGPGGINGSAEQLRLVRGEGEDEVSVPVAGEWSYHVGAAYQKLPPIPTTPNLGNNSPGVLYHGMIAPLTPLKIRGITWYQGESNVFRPDAYAALFPAMIRDWRRSWGAELPFYFVQIAPYRYTRDGGQTARLREAQAAALAEPNTGMVVTLDVGNAVDVHPADKRTVGSRLAALALKQSYGQSDRIAEGPRYASHRVDGNTVSVDFVGVGSGLEARDELKSVVIAGADRQFHVARATVRGNTLEVSSPRVPQPVAVRYAWEAAPEATLFNREGFPAAPFRTDRWDDPLPPVEDDGATEYFTQEEGFVPLFNGKDLSGWVNVNCAPETWTVDQGRIVCSGIPTGILRTEKMYENFVLDLEWRHLQPGGNAGLFVWSDALTARGVPFSRSVEVQVLDGSESDGHTSDGDIFPIHGATMVPLNGRGGTRAFPTEKRARWSPHWNHYRVTCQDGRIELKVNGKVVTQGHSASPRRGFICLESEGSEIHFRNLQIRELPASSAPLPDADVAAAAPGFVPLYNGLDLRGWKADPKNDGHWVANDWRLSFDGKGTHLWSEKSYRDVEIICDWRWTAAPKPTDYPVILPSGEVQKDENGETVHATVPSAGDSGIYLRGNDKSQVNIWCWPIGSGEVYGYRNDSSLSAEVRRGVTPKERADAPIGSWNRMFVRMKGDRLTVILNGKTVIESAQLPGVPEEGPIALQAHGDPIEFANIFIREL